MVLGSGVSVISVKSIEKKLKSAERHPFKKLFTPSEIRYCEKKRYSAEHFAGRLAAKTACLSALGLKYDESLFAQIQVIRKPSGQPTLKIKASLFSRFQTRRATVHLSMAHERDAAIAFVLLSKSRD